MHAADTRSSRSLCVVAAGERIPQQRLREEWLTPPVQSALFVARQRFGHALCECRSRPLKLQIRLRDNKCHLAVWPQEGPDHDSECLFFHDEVAERASALAALRAAARPAAEGATGTSSEHEKDLHVAEGAAPRIAASVHLQYARPSAPPASVSPNATVNVKALAQRLWEAASLCRWHPAWTRDWGRTRYQIYRAAQEFSLDGLPLSELLFAPRPYREADALLLDREWDAFVRRLQVGNVQQSSLLIAPLRRLSPPTEDRPATVSLRHLRAPIGLSHSCYDFVTRACRNGISNSWLGAAMRANDHSPTELDRNGIRRPELIGFFLVDGASRGGIWARAAWLMPVHPTTFIPAANGDVVALVDQLVGGGYAFQHLPSDLPAARRTQPDLLVRHILGPDGVPVARAALEIMSPAATGEYAACRASIAKHLASEGVPTWVWSPLGARADRAPPPLPPQDRAPQEQGKDQLRRIALHPRADYRYGPSSKFSTTTTTERTSQ